MELSGLGCLVAGVPLELDDADFCFALLLPDIAGGTAAGEPLMFALAIEPPASVDQ
jgi:hypothetical protein